MTRGTISLIFCFVLAFFTGCASSGDTDKGAGNNSGAGNGSGAGNEVGQGGDGGDPADGVGGQGGDPVDGEGGTGGDLVVGGGGSGGDSVNGQGGELGVGGQGGNLVSAGGSGGDPVVVGAGGSGGDPVVVGAGGSGGDPVVVGAGGSGGDPVVVGAGGSGGDPVVVGAGGQGGEECQPQEEICNNADDDCDGRSDENVFGGVCTAGVGACEREGTRVCVIGNFLCDAAPGQAVDELCNDMDDDCDGTVDEVFINSEDDAQSGLGEDCVVGIGPCENEGTFVCAADQQGLACSAEPLENASRESCDGRDNDCDGVTDEDFDLSDDCAPQGVGLCRVEGAMQCIDDDNARCVYPVSPEPSEDICSGEDEDCDGAVDEDFNVGEPCQVGEGVCAVGGVLICNPIDGRPSICDVEPGEPEIEVCDMLDNDCDGETDEEFNLATNPSRCGACDVVCGENEYCEEGECVPSEYFSIEGDYGNHMCALHRSGDVRCWGNHSQNLLPVLGNLLGDVFERVPQTIEISNHNQFPFLGPDDPRTDMDRMRLIATTDWSACALRESAPGNNEVYPYCWGRNQDGAMANAHDAVGLIVCGDNGEGCSSEGLQVPVTGLASYDDARFEDQFGETDIIGTVIAIDSVKRSADEWAVCGRTDEGWLYCWEYENHGDDNIANDSLSIRALGQYENMLGFECKGSLCCLLDRPEQNDETEVRCWYTLPSRSGAGTLRRTSRIFPSLVNPMRFAEKISVGHSHMCWTDRDEFGEVSVRCFGYIKNGDGAISSVLDTVRDLPDPERIVDLEGGEDLHCAAYESSVYCWGDLSLFGIMDTHTATLIPDFDLEGDFYKQLSIYQSTDGNTIRICALRRSGAIQCISNDGNDWTPQAAP